MGLPLTEYKTRTSTNLLKEWSVLKRTAPRSSANTGTGGRRSRRSSDHKSTATAAAVAAVAAANSSVLTSTSTTARFKTLKRKPAPALYVLDFDATGAECARLVDSTEIRESEWLEGLTQSVLQSEKKAANLLDMSKRHGRYMVPERPVSSDNGIDSESNIENDDEIDEDDEDDADVDVDDEEADDLIDDNILTRTSTWSPLLPLTRADLADIPASLHSILLGNSGAESPRLMLSNLRRRQRRNGTLPNHLVRFLSEGLRDSEVYQGTSVDADV
ncbi:hypothetical protein CANCADRAFT_107061 [Tortispora caseinolytica NRRL Y-17796]|uniref:Uncharacterized protein n=1 Tax=Tortispora caseinolytica NRRL Y-17796 TaxID=767744 RepID=A0A1E4TFE0_9ASCO|nr:hypothetical protein CANCADRAFT_107061 [Tortispora caseinolytica NRRL Y-17796]